ncbi:MAG: hypothetical protein ABSH52_31455 [Terriglobia bacterium]
MSRGKIYAGAASLIVGLSAVSRLLILQSPKYATHDFGLAIATTGVVICLLLGGIILGAIARGTLGWLGVVACGVGLAFWGLIAFGELL